MIARRLANIEGVAYFAADLGEYALPIVAKTDITRLAFQSERFDLIICLHVLEHVIDDIEAMRELYRVMAGGGQAIIAVPVEMSRMTTYEDPTIVSAEARLDSFHQSDHVRIYGRDIVNRFEEAGFEVTIERASDLDQQTIDRYGLWDEEVMFICKKG
jgi:predicted SAM-dependent methyltransferase